MSQAVRSRVRDGRSRDACLLPVLLLVSALTAVPAAGATAPRQEDDPSLDGGSAEVRFPTPARHAVVLQQAGQVRALYGCGDVIVHPHEPGRALTVVRVEPSHLMVREGARGGAQVVHAGDPLPGVPGRTFAGTVLLDAVHYRYRRVARVVHLDPVLLALDGARALLEVEVAYPAGPAAGVPAAATDGPVAGLGSPVRPTLDVTLLSQVQVRETAPDRYDVRAAEVQAVLENAGRVLAELAPGVVPTLSTTGGVQYRITSAASDGVLGRQGFTVWAPKLAARAGIEPGDTILSVNGVPVDGIASLYRIYQQVRHTPALATIQMEVERGGTRVTKTYRLR
jgi:hypothetical protein